MNLTYWFAGITIVGTLVGIIGGYIPGTEGTAIILAALTAFGAKISQPTNTGSVKGLW